MTHPRSDLEGEFDANYQGLDRLWSRVARVIETVEIEHKKEGYYDVHYRNASGNVEFATNQAAYRIEGALEGPGGYDYHVDNLPSDHH